ncbi:hypothetical protein NLC29_02840 [Candidatus Aminicenantes bacterium AH-873-B07]|nr:hypothetical protein [Candidatus Aminicenantes bacterium AH-873-B07]
MSFEPKYISILKNVRGVIYFSEKDKILEEIKWLRKHFRYRYLGISKNLLKNINEKNTKQTLLKKPFIQLYYPNENIETFVNSFYEITKINLPLLESLFLSSCYVSPFFILGEEALKQCETFILHFLEISGKLDDKELKRHLRFADYGVIDIHEHSTQYAWKQLKQASLYQLEGKIQEAKEILKSLIKERKKLADSDCETRYWRLRSEKDYKATKAVVYLDPCFIISKNFEDRDIANSLSKLILNYSKEVSISFALVTGFFISA